MATQRGTKQKVYMYAIVPDGESALVGTSGLDGRTVFAVGNGRLAAVVSEASERLRPERRHLAAHQQVLKRLLESNEAVLPVSFGLVADGLDAVRRILVRNQRQLTDQLRRVSQRVEMGLRVTWDVPNIFEYFVDTHDDLRAARDRMFGPHGEPSQDDKIEIGRLFERCLVDDREFHTGRVEDVLGPVCVEIKRNPARKENEVMNLACLVERNGQPAFEAAVLSAAQLFDNSYAFDYSGPWAPHNFVELCLDLRGSRAPARVPA